ncbi:hypothetical protein IQ255_10055 [Pleurocapsales cyanobacterium LEGE 10410]|nr:hypothetical protein [Pleurocapsales cyanobacterium LEGE 10410]
MSYKFLLTVFLTSLGSLGALAPIAVAQERPKCYIIDPSGQLTDLSDICDVSQKQSPDTETATTDTATNDGLNIINNNNNTIYSEPSTRGLSEGSSTYILGGDDFSFDSGSSFIDSSYYIDNEIGVDYTAYIRRYKVPPTFLVRPTLKDQVFGFDHYRNSPTSILRRGQSRIPFIVYRYQK